MAALTACGGRKTREAQRNQYDSAIRRYSDDDDDDDEIDAMHGKDMGNGVSSPEHNAATLYGEQYQRCAVNAEDANAARQGEAGGEFCRVWLRKNSTTYVIPAPGTKPAGAKIRSAPRWMI